VVVKRILCIIAGIAVAAGRLSASTLVTVDANSGPWLSQHNGINASDFFGTGDEANPTIISSLGGAQIVSGDAISITYENGTASPGQGWPFTDAAGMTIAENNFHDGNGNVWPSFYMPLSDYPVYEMQLVGTFADASGDIVGTPFPVGLLATETVPAGASQLQLGVNDSLYADNAGSFVVQVSSVPEPSCVGLIGFALLLGRRRLVTTSPRRLASRGDRA
jgi:hypothetical protein